MKYSKIVLSVNSVHPDIIVNPAKITGVSFEFKEVSMKLDSDGKTGTIPGLSVNGATAVYGQEYSIMTADKSYFLIHTSELNTLELNVTFRFEKADGHESVYGILYVNGDAVIKSTADITSSGTSLTATNASFQLMRTNPKLSGNIKLMVTPGEKMFLDTFKVTDALGKSAYRHYSVSGKSSYSTDVKNCFGSLSTSDIYAVPETALTAHQPYTDFESQFNRTYCYGAETNTDSMYSENFSILAPLWLNRVLPDFFLIFRIDDAYNKDSYSGSVDDTEKLRSFLKEGKLVKAYDMRSSSALGTYIRNYYSEFSQYPGSMLLQFKEYEQQNAYANGVNSWYGISLNSGLIVKKDEISYFAHETLEKNSQAKMNQFYTSGFERNKLLCPNLLNLDFTFNDEDAGDYEMNRYFGIYVKENDFITYDYVENVIDSGTQNTVIRKYDSSHNEVDDSALKGSNSVFRDSSYSDRIFCAVASDAVARVKSTADVDTFLRKEVTNVPYVNFQSCEVTAETTTMNNFVTVDFSERIRYGEHFRICFPDMSALGVSFPVVIELIASNNPELASEADCCLPFVAVTNSKNDNGNYVFYREKTNKPADYENSGDVSSYYYDGFGDMGNYASMYNVKYNSSFFDDIQSDNECKVRFRELTENLSTEESGDYVTDEYPYIFRTCFYTQEISDSATQATLDEQIVRMCACLKKITRCFGFDITTGYVSGNSLSLMTSYGDAYFQHITADILDASLAATYTDSIDSSYTDGVVIEKYIHDEPVGTGTDTIGYFGQGNATTLPLNPHTDDFDGMCRMFAPVNFELLGWRETSAVEFATFSGNKYEISSSDISKIIPNTLIRTKSGSYSRLCDMTVGVVNLSQTSGVTDNGGTYKSELLERYSYLGQLDSSLKAARPEGLTDASLELAITAAETEMCDISANMDNLRQIVKNVYVEMSLDKQTSQIMASPFTAGKYIIETSGEPHLYNGFLDLYSTTSMSVALMGIMPVRDFDMVIGDSSSVSVSGNSVITVDNATRIYTDTDNEKYSLTSGVMYSLSSGYFDGIKMRTGGNFVLLDDKIYYMAAGDESIASQVTGGYLTARCADGEHVIITGSCGSNTADYAITSPAMLETDFFKDDDVKSDLDYSLVVPTVTQWCGTGMYYDHDSTLKVSSVTSYSADGISGGYITDFSDGRNGSTADMYVPYSLESLMNVGGVTVSARDFMLNSTMTDTVNTYLSGRFRPAYTVGYYNTYVNTLDFILYGVKFSLTFNTNQFVREIQLSNYNKYEIYIVNEYTGKKNEMIINTIENTILIVDHNYSFRTSGSSYGVFGLNNGIYSDSCGYTWCNSPYTIDTGNAEADDCSIYIPLMDGSVDRKSELLWQFGVQPDYATTPTAFMTSASSTGSPFELSADASFFTLTDNAIKCSLFDFSQDSDVSVSAVLVNPEAETSYTGIDDMTADFIDSLSADRLIVYVKKQSSGNTSVSKIETSDSYCPIKITHSTPVHVKYCTDFYNPKFRDIILFELDDTAELRAKTKTGFVLSNTHLASVSGISGVYGYKTFGSISQNLTTVSSMFSAPASVLSSCWDKSFFRLYTTPNDYGSINGYVPGILTKSFFGSVGMKIPSDKIEINSWDEADVTVSTTSVSDYAITSGTTGSSASSATVKINMTEAFYRKFTASESALFTDNWSGLSDSANAINNFVKLTLSGFYRIGETGGVHLFAKPADTFEMSLTVPDDAADYSEVTNFNGTYSVENDETYLTITLSDMTKKYYIICDISPYAD